MIYKTRYGMVANPFIKSADVGLYPGPCVPGEVDTLKRIIDDL